MNSNEIRTAFLEFFDSRGHHIVPSAPMVIKDDPTLMFTNAGMNQFKDIFLGNEPVKWSRIADTQKCLRVSGKHNDLEEVGLDTYHHTMFEMLGNWSFGDYFKKEAISWAWEFLTGRLKIPAGRLYATVFEGDSAENLERDNDSADFWAAYLPAHQILDGGKKDNFWEMGDSGPCGPCSEIHVDIREDAERLTISGRELVNRGHPLVIEIWNLVFIQFNRKANGLLENLPSRHVDTGMGFERLCMVMQGKKSNYDTDIFREIINATGRLCGKVYGQNEKSDVAMRVIADHLRAVSFAVADGQIPSNNKAGYVIRRILRRAVRYGYTFLGLREPFLCRLAGVLAENMGEAFPELRSQKQLIERVLHEEEESFLKTLETGIRLMEQISEKAKSDGKTEISGRDAFLLYDTYGFPLDLTQLIARENGLTIDIGQFSEEMLRQKERSRNAAIQETGDWTELIKTEKVEFTGYRELETLTRIARYRSVLRNNKNFYQVVLEKTPFYAESGGQVGDSGYLESEGERTEVLNTVRENNLIIHIVAALPKNPEALFRASVDVKRRRSTACNHTATHLLDHALREILGKHVEQKGSLVHPDYLRFDFSHFGKMSREELEAVQNRVNQMIRQNLEQEEINSISMDEAREMGAIAIFGEKYGDMVRAVRFGDSVELCGGTHVPATGLIGQFIILSEGAISAGVRRIEAITGDRADEFIAAELRELAEARSLFSHPKNIGSAIMDLQEENNRLSKQVETFEIKAALAIKQELIKGIRKVGEVNLIAGQPEIDTLQGVKDLAFMLKAEVPLLYLVLGGSIGSKPYLTILISEELVSSRNLDASKIIRDAAREIQGGGGGQPFYATAGGKNPAGVAAAIEKAISVLSDY